MQKVILSNYMNYFFARGKMMLNPSLHGKEVAVCDSAEYRHEIIIPDAIKLASFYGGN